MVTSFSPALNLLTPENQLANGLEEVTSATRDRWQSAPSRGRVGQKLLDLTSQRVIISILALLLIIPGFNINSGLYGDSPDFAYWGLNVLHDSCGDSTPMVIPHSPESSLLLPPFPVKQAAYV